MKQSKTPSSVMNKPGIEGRYKARRTLRYRFSSKHKAYIEKCAKNTFNIAEGAVRAGKTVDNVVAFAMELMTTPDKIHLATGSTMANAKLNIGDCNGLGLEWIFRGQSRWGQYKGNDCLYVCGPATRYRTRIVIFAGGSTADSFKKIRGNSYGMWIATEINLHHDNTIKEAFNRQLAARRRKIFWDLNPDHPRAPIYTKYIDRYRQRDAEGKLIGGCNYEHFTIFDNVNVSDDRRQEIVSQYEEGSFWFQRDILGARSVAEGAIYTKFGAVTSSDNNYLCIPVEKAQAMADNREFLKIVIGVDFGGAGSGHAFVATAPTLGYEKLVGLASELHTKQDIDPNKLGELFVTFAKKIIMLYGFVTHVYCDSAEPVLIRGLRKAMAEQGLGNVPISNAAKERINDRIFAMTTLNANDRFIYTTDCETLEMALRGATWDPKHLTPERLDDGSSDIDSLDACEYSYERDIRRYVDIQARRADK